MEGEGEGWDRRDGKEEERNGMGEEGGEEWHGRGRRRGKSREGRVRRCRGDD